MSRQRTDVAIQGAGMVGLFAALRLARAGLSVSVLDAERPPVWRGRGGEYRQRVSALNRHTEALLDADGVWAAMAAARVSPFRAITAEDAAGGGRVHFDAAEVGEPHLGHIVENDLVRAMLARACREAGVHFSVPGAVQGWAEEESALILDLGEGRQLQTGLLVGADGAGSAIREQAGIAVDHRGYGQRAIVAAVETGEPHGETARQRFLAGGPVAFLPLADGRCSIVWSLPESEAEAILRLEDAAFVEVLNEAAGSLVGGVTGSGPRGAFPLHRLHARRYIAERVALVGDAAHVIHPLAGQGANLGFRDAETLAAEVAAARERGRDPGGTAVLRRFERARRGDNLAVQAAMEAFHQAFTRGEAPLVALRSLGFNLTDRLPPLKHAFMRLAMGRALG
ncbi:UbiH/UbiF/VisC/COQ6 family ubiquinone biosynthesis hydroxylase [Sediminicurvatus halobius]|uniref:2-octaprenyl-3-methyl-6-methoxy-1,4-benzoquinol hydroxylase n=1 Tax=Sediminicurvatus halobius TaxID=2182432 RepID=A0A2U2N1N0_9GAMM|nr:UbiH/UbiF/VisC/COQ6 family ubiquinone biosynthesis hydroxylase [Spiribacter halobius]PWG62967.1 2-octaprenyl-3-methyl-6-methoxy-1,4-benzoquinol hydroxylase [Spiribacter halobius]UEX77481.1 UbiH/UbiF/VisC/COQ6 family ubiquinone biosynthesis hydroxylase [Spiribacter halobius]